MMRAEPPDWLDDKQTDTKLVIEETNTGQWDYNFATDPLVTDLMRTADTVRYPGMRPTLVKLFSASSEGTYATTAWRKLSLQCPASPVLSVSWRSSYSRGGILGFLCSF